MSKRFFRLALSCLLGSVAQAGPAPTVTVEEHAELMMVYIHDLDRLQAAYPGLSAEVRLAGVETTYRIDLVADYQTPAILIRKKEPVACGKVQLILRDGTEELLRRDYATKIAPPVPPAVPLSEATAFIERGGGLTGESPVIVQPDLAKLPTIELPDAPRTIDMNAVTARVASESNFPLVSSNNNCAISRQTAHPDDPNRRSCYIPLKSQIYDPSTGAPIRLVHYLAEVPLNADWLEGAEDAVVHVGAAEIRIHTPDKHWPPGSPTAQLLTGEGAAGLAQGAGGLTADDDGNLYYCSEMAAEVVRFNVRKAEWEAPPIQFVEAIDTLLPKREELPESFRKEGVRWDVHRHVMVGGGRLFLVPLRNAVYGKVYCNGVISFPLAQWGDAEKFRAGMRLVACSWPGTPVSLYDSWPQPREAARTIEPGVYHDFRYWLGGYSNSVGPWSIELNADAAGLRAVAATEADVNRALLATMPPLPRNAPGFINWWDYGVLTVGRAELSQLLTGTRHKQATGTVRIYYDAIAAMRRTPARYSLILENLKGPSLAPSYMAVSIPNQPGHLLGVGEYGYQLADLDFTGIAKGAVAKRFLPLDTGAAQSLLPVKIGLGPYGRLWRRDGDRLFLIMTGYTGVAQMLYSVGNQPPERFDAELLHLNERSLDGSPAGGFKWHQFPVAGIDGRVYLTGNHQADRGGHPYASGLMAFSPAQPQEAVRLARMTRACNTRYLRTRLLYDPDGRKRQEFILAGGMSLQAYIQLLNGANLPENRDAKLFFYECVEGQEPKDLLGVSLPVVEGKSGADCQVLSRDRRHLVTLQQGCILTFDLAAKRYIDGRRIDAEVWRFSKPDFQLTVAPDDRIFLCLQPRDAARTTFYEVDVTARGAIALKPHLTITGPTTEAVKSLNGAALAFVSDPQGDGSYDLCIAADWRAPSTTLRLIQDFLTPRP